MGVTTCERGRVGNSSSLASVPWRMGACISAGTEATGAPTGGPEGLRYFPDFLSPEGEHALLPDLLTLPGEAWSRPAVRLNPSRRRMACFGWNYDTASRRQRPP